MKNLSTVLIVIFLVSTYFVSSCATDNLKADRVADMSECVVVLHGMGRSASAMKKIEKAFKKEGYATHNKSYNSTIGEKGMLEAVTSGVDYCKAINAEKIHFITHSLGGIAVRYYLTQHELGLIDSIVMLGPPNHGSEVADRFKDKGWYKSLNKRSGQLLTTNEDSFVNQLGPLPKGVRLGVIAGTKSSDPWFNYIFDRPHDGKVAVESTKLEGMLDHLEVKVGHTSIMKNKLVIKNALYFVEQGQFLK